MQRPGRNSQETRQVLVPPQGNLPNSIFEPFCRTETPNKWKNYLMKKEDPLGPVLRLLNIIFEKQCKLASPLILIYSPIFHFPNYKTIS